jgi:GAF domain-containing protein
VDRLRSEGRYPVKPGGELKVETTICHEIRQSGTPVIIDHVAQDQVFCMHPTPAMYGFQSYISMPIVRADGTFFGTLGLYIASEVARAHGGTLQATSTPEETSFVFRMPSSVLTG